MCVRVAASDALKSVIESHCEFHDDLVNRMQELKAVRYNQVTIQLVHGHEAAIEDWAEVFKATRRSPVNRASPAVA